MSGTAIISPCERYRYLPPRAGGAPIHAELARPRPTGTTAIRRCRRFAEALGLRLRVMNIFAAIDKPRAMKRASPRWNHLSIRPENDRHRRATGTSAVDLAGRRLHSRRDDAVATVAPLARTAPAALGEDKPAERPL